MIRIPGENLWLGHVGDARNLKAVYDAGIVALVDLALNDPAPQIPHDLIYCRIPLVDGTGNKPELLWLAIHTTACLLQTRVPTLVYCSAGLSRAPAIVAGALTICSGLSPEDSLQRIAEVHPLDMSPGLWQNVVTEIHSPE